MDCQSNVKPRIVCGAASISFAETNTPRPAVARRARKNLTARWGAEKQPGSLNLPLQTLPGNDVSGSSHGPRQVTNGWRQS